MKTLNFKLFVTVLCLCAVINNAQAQFYGSGSSGNPYLIQTAADLEQLATYVNARTSPYADAGKHYLLINNIDLSDYGAGFNGGKGWIPIGWYSYPNDYAFRGIFNGGGRVISGLYINDGTRSNAGLFGVVSGSAELKNIVVENVNITGNNYVGGVVAQYSSSVNLSHCYASGIVKGETCVGGIVGQMAKNISDCYSACTVSGNTEIGGVAGFATVSSLANCYATGAVSGNNNVGGIIGSATSSTTPIAISSSAALNISVKSSGANVGRIAGYTGGAVALANNIAFDGIINYAGNTTWNNKGLTSKDGADITKAAINADGTLGNRITAPVWTTANGKLPGFFGKTVDMPWHLMLGDGTSGNPYIITAAAQLAQLATVVNAVDIIYNNKHYKLGNDIDLSAYGASFNGGKGWIPIGKYDSDFKGSFDGSNFKITNLYINNAALDDAGLFGSIRDNAVVKNLGVENVNIIGKRYVGGISGNITSNSKMENCYSTGTVNGDNSIGGIVGFLGNSSGVVSATLTNCYSTADVSGYDDVGGLAGYIGNNGKIENCYSIGIVNGNNNVGGVTGSMSNSSLYNCAALNPSVKGTTANVGRITGYRLGGNISNNIAWNGILNNSGNTTWDDKGLTQKDGADTSAEAINADGALGGRFTSANGWTTANGKLPGLFGKTVDMPAHLLSTGIEELRITNYELRVYPNPTHGELIIESGEMSIENVEIYDISGRKQEIIFNWLRPNVVFQFSTFNSIDISHLANGVYFLKIGNETSKIVKK